jgi:hypothetical protein
MEGVEYTFRTGTDRLKRIVILFALTSCFIFSCEKKPSPISGPAEDPSVSRVVVEKEKEEKMQPLPAEVKIKLKKDGKNNYSWELSSSDVDQVLKVNEKLKKRLGESTK